MPIPGNLSSYPAFHFDKALEPLLSDPSTIIGVLGLPLLAAILFAGSALLMKRTTRWHIEIWRVSFVCNVVSMITFQPFWLLAGDLPPWSLWWQPFGVALLYVVGQVLTLTSLSQGEISVAAPVLGLKIVFVPIFLWLLGAGLLPVSTWLACLGATLAVMLLNSTDGASERGKVLYSIVTATSGAAAFALFDVCIQLWSPTWGPGAFLPVMMGMSTLLSLALFPFFKQPLRAISRDAWPTLSGAALLIALQAVAIVASVAFWEQVAVSNVVYSTRGLWSLAAVWMLGRYLGASDSSLTPRVFMLRSAGALLLFASIALLVFV